MKDKFRAYVYRAFVVNFLYGFSSFFALFYLVNFEEIKNWNCIYVFIPMFFLAVSTETGTRNPKLKSYRVKPYNIIDFCVKCVVFVIVEIGYRRAQVDALFRGIVLLTTLLVAVSFMLEWKMLKILNAEKMQTNGVIKQI